MSRLSDTPSGNSSAAGKRPNPYENTNNEAKRQRTYDKVSQDLLDEWLSALLPLPSSALPRVEALLRFIAIGTEYPYQKNDEQQVYDDLIRSEAHNIFLEVFAAFNQITWPDTPEGDRPDPFKLVLQQAHDWDPILPNLMIEALEDLPVRRLVLFPERADANSYYWLPKAVNNFLSALLTSERSSLTEIVFNGVLEAPDKVARAFAQSRLQAIEFGWMEQQAPDEEEMEHYRTLARGLADCSTLTHIHVSHPSFFALHTQIDEFPSTGPQLSSVGWDLDPQYPVSIDYGQPHLQPQYQEFMWTVREFATLKTVSVEASVANGESLNEVFIKPLTGHAALAQLTIVGESVLPTDPTTLSVLPLVASLSASCPCLTQFEWSEGELPQEAGDNLREFQRAGGDLAMAGPCAALAHAMAAPTFGLQSITFNGGVVLTSILGTLVSSLQHNKTLWYLNLDRCHTSLRSALALVNMLQTHTTLKHVVLSQEHDDYYFETSDGNIHGFRTMESDSDDDQPQDFTLSFAEELTDAQRALALKEFGELEGEANQLFARLRAHNLRGQREMAMATASPARHITGNIPPEVQGSAPSTTQASTTATTITTTTSTTTTTTTTTGTTSTSKS
ncbi:hypothetical protein [Hydrogenophaga sp. BPS33]|uniref:hypothetical protein n=1 Tax=Hydrogenophaga sp. BPS33 TaxID=2651974 RepID=UPI0019177A73|nr:hypothetical protein [Hydrogenophaga sp. BPS33]